MTDTIIFLTLNRLQRTQFFAHLFVFLLTSIGKTPAPRSEANLDLTHEVAYRLHQTCNDARENVVFTLSMDECRIITSVLLRLIPAYEQAAHTETGMTALQDLSACLALLGDAEQHAVDAERA